ncbi:TetR/AcrR family transcriptional regulator [Gordonia sp. NPDC003429]
MRTHGWGGRVPRNDDEARARILAAAREAIDEHGVAASISDVARSLGVTRQTVYRYFSGTEELLRATALDAVGDFLDRIIERIAGIAEPDVAVVDGVEAVLEELTTDRYVGVLFAQGHLSLPAVGEVTSQVGHDFVLTMVTRMDVDWAAAGYGERELDLVAEMVLRTLQSMVLDPGTRDPTGRRAFLDAWLGAAMRALSVTPACR